MKKLIAPLLALVLAGCGVHPTSALAVKPTTLAAKSAVVRIDGVKISSTHTVAGIATTAIANGTRDGVAFNLVATRFSDPAFITLDGKHVTSAEAVALVQAAPVGGTFTAPLRSQLLGLLR